MTDGARELPKNIEAEKMVLGAILLNPQESIDSRNSLRSLLSSGASRSFEDPKGTDDGPVVDPGQQSASRSRASSRSWTREQARAHDGVDRARGTEEEGVAGVSSKSRGVGVNANTPRRERI